MHRRLRDCRGARADLDLTEENIMDTLPHNGAVITLLAVTGLTHKQAYRDIFAITLIKTAAVAVAIAVYYATGLY